MAKRKFKTEVNQLLKLIVHSLYSHAEIFLRELISNSSDALDKMKYLTLTEDGFKDYDFDPRIDITIDEENQQLTVADTGIGMNDQDLADNLGTIARSGTKQFLSQLTGDAKKDSNLIGQFGVGFYSVFMVADEVEVVSRKAGEDQAWKWKSDGQTGFSISEAERDQAGTTITIHLNEEGKEYASRWQVEQVIKKYSNHIAFPIFIHYQEEESEGEGDEKTTKKVPKTEQVNSASAMWKRSKNELSAEDYHEFYKTVFGDTEEPLLYVHTQAEGTLEYTTLFFIPKKAPFDMYQADYQPGVKLYVKRVFITDDDKELLPPYLRFVRGIIDSEDLPLNVSREILQKNRVMTNIRNTAVKKILGELEKLTEDKESYQTFIEQFNRPLKEGVYGDFANRDKLLELVRYKSTKVDGWVSLADYKARMKEDQKAIYYISGGSDEATLRNSPLLEAYAKKDIEVLIMDDEIDDMVTPMIGQYQETSLKAVNRAGSTEDIKEEGDEAKEKDAEGLVKAVKEALGDRVKDVRVSHRLSDSPSCIVLDDSDMSLQMQQMLKQMGQADLPEITPILEINPDHEIVKNLEKEQGEEMMKDVSTLLLEEAMLVEGIPLKEPSAFVKRLNRVMARVV